MRRDTANGDVQMKFSYRDSGSIPGPWAQVRFRFADGNNFPLLTMYPTSFTLAEKRSGTVVTLATGAWTTTSGAWYDVTIIADGPHLEVWRGPKGGAQSRVCSVDNGAVLSGTKTYLIVAPTATYAFDDFQMTAEDLSNTTYTYDTANQLTAMNVNGTVTNFTYDDWGRNTGKTQGSYTATYGYRYGDKLATSVSGFPGEALATVYEYDGLGKRRDETAIFSGQPTQNTWFRWSGWEESGEYAAGTGGQVIGAKQTGYVPGLAAYAGADPATADWRFNLNDHLGSPRHMLGQDKSAKARQDFSPYGELMRSAGLPLTVGYTGHRWDPAIGQYFAPFRYYNPQTARWNMRDPLGFIDGPNVYAYVVGNPVEYLDSLGLTDSPGTELPKINRYCNANPKTGEPEGQEPNRTPMPDPQPAPQQQDPVPKHGGDWDPGNFDLPDPSLETPIRNLFEKSGQSPSEGWYKPSTKQGSNWTNGEHKSISDPAAHEGHELHIDVHLPDKTRYRVYPDGTCEPKK